MKTKETKTVTTDQKYISNITIDNTLNAKNYRSTKIDKANKMLAGLNLERRVQSK
jgi:hypothetical protein